MAGDPASVNPLAGGEARRHLQSMAGKDKEKEERLAAALRENLRRRKTKDRELSKEERGKPDPC